MIKNTIDKLFGLDMLKITNVRNVFVNNIKANLVVCNSTFSGNYVMIDNSTGGAVVNYNGSKMTICNSTFENNHGVALGGAIFTRDSNTVSYVYNSIFWNNCSAISIYLYYFSCPKNLTSIRYISNRGDVILTGYNRSV